MKEKRRKAVQRRIQKVQKRKADMPLGLMEFKKTPQIQTWNGGIKRDLKISEEH